jgi:TPR repeat protein
MSPEQAQLSMQDIDTRSDIYSLGVLLYELLTGTTPFETEELLAKGLDEMRRTIREVEPPKPSTRLTQSLVAADVRRLTSKSDEKNSVSSRRLIQEIKGDLDLIVMKCLEKDRTRRYETATGLSADILRHLNDEPISARPPSKLYEFQRTFKRHKFGFAATAAVIVALAAGLAVSTRMYWAAQIEKKNAQAEKKKAQTEAARSEQVAQFMKDMLKGVGPSVSLGRDTRLLKEILDQTAERLGKDLTDQLAVQAELRATLGNVYRDLGEYTNAAAMYRETFEQRKKMFGLEHPDTAASLYELGEALRLQGRNSEAEPAIREALRIRKKLFGDKHLEVARSLDSLALLIYYWRRQWGESEALFREALDIRRKLLGNAHVEVADSLTHLGVMLNSHGRYAEAEAAHREALALRRKLLGSEHPEIARSLHEVAWSLRLAGNLAEAESMFREALAMRRKLLDEGHPDLVDTLLNLGRTFEDARKFDDAAALYREALEMIRKRLGSDHPRMVSPLSSLATVLSRQGKLTEAERLCRQALAINTDSYGGWLPSVTFLTDNLTRVLREEGKTNEAETVAHLKAVEVAEKNRKLADQGNPQAQEYMGWAYLNGRGVVKDPVEAVKWYRKAAEQDNTDVQNFLGWMYANGQDVPRDHVEADKWYRKAAEAGNRWAQHSLALQYLTGSGVPRDDREALKLFRKAADQDHQPAQLLLARMYAEGRGVETNRTEAACWYEKAIRIADPSALNQYAWFLATSLEPAFRDGTKAIALAEKAAAATGRTNVMVLDTLAVAYAEAGQFEKAISVQKDAIVRLSSREDRPILESHLKLFESRTPLRE